MYNTFADYLEQSKIEELDEAKKCKDKKKVEAPKIAPETAAGEPVVS